MPNSTKLKQTDKAVKTCPEKKHWVYWLYWISLHSQLAIHNACSTDYRSAGFVSPFCLGLWLNSGEPLGSKAELTTIDERHQKNIELLCRYENTDESTRPQTEWFYCFWVFGNADETLCTSFWNSFSIAPQEMKENGNIYEFFTRCRQVCCSNIQIKKSVHQCLMLYLTQGFDIIWNSGIARHSGVSVGLSNRMHVTRLAWIAWMFTSIMNN